MPAQFMTHMHASCDEGGKTLEQVAQRSGRWSILKHIQGQVGWTLERSELAENVPGHCRRVELSDLQRSLPTKNLSMTL